MRLFRLNRLKDETGISGTGIVAVGVVLPSGKCILEWRTALSSIAVYDSIEDVEAIHGHSGRTLVEWED